MWIDQLGCPSSLNWTPLRRKPLAGFANVVRFCCFIWVMTAMPDGTQALQLNSKLLTPVNSADKETLTSAKLSRRSVIPLSEALLGSRTLVVPASTRNVTTQIGSTTYLHCFVDRLEDKTVSWIRLRDFHLLTVGLYTYTSDTRFQTVCNEYCSDWTLQIRHPELNDEGLYECQISSDPPISHYVNLKVLVPKTKILGGPHFYVGVGSEVNLTCVITDCPEPPAFVFWYHDNRMINYDVSRGDISIQKAGQNTALSRLFIKNAQSTDSGNYSCCPSNADAASIFVHVLRGEKHAAVQNDAATSRSTRFASSIYNLFLFEVLLILCIICER